MTIGTIDWGAHAGILEEVAAVFLAQDAPDVMRRTPSSGDGGVDVLVPVEGGWHVYQVKSFTGRVTKGGRRSQVESSLEEAIKDPRLSKKAIVRWSLVVPIDATSGEQAWFEEVTDAAPFECNWLGEVWWNSMGARHGHVVDYYFRDGRNRIEERIRAMTSPADLVGRAPTALDVATQYEVLRSALEKEDPHYRYTFHIGDVPPSAAAAPESAVLLHSQRCAEGDGFWAVYVIPKHRYALTDSPIRQTFTITAFDEDRGLDLRRQIEDFRDFGCQLDIPAGALNGHLQAPGGLATVIEDGSATIMPIEPSGGLMESRLRLTDAAKARHESVLHTTVRSHGEAGGSELQAEDATGLLRLKARIMPPDPEGRSGLWWQVTLGDVAGGPVDDVLPLVRMMLAAENGAELRWMERHGATVYARHRFDEPQGDHGFLSDLLPILEDLFVIQDRVAGTVLVPDELDATDLSDIHEIAYMARHGELSGTWTEGSFSLKPGFDRRELVDLFTPGGQLLQTGPMVLDLAGQTYDLGPSYRLYRHAVLAKVQPLDDRIVKVEAGPDNSTLQGLGELPGL